MDEKQVEQRLQHFLNMRLSEKGTINAMMGMEKECINYAKQTMTLLFPVKAWQLNPANHMHGGMLTTAMDITMGCAAYIFSEAEFTPTIQMAVNFNASINEADTLYIQGICDHAGSRMAQVRAIATKNGSEQIVASANGSYAINMRR